MSPDRSKQARKWPPGRWFVVAAVCFGFLVFGYQLICSDEAPYSAFLKASGATGLLLILLGLGQRLWEGDKMQGGQLPGGAGADFEPAEAAEETRGAVEKLNQRVTTQSDQMITLQQQLDRRVRDLEEQVFKGRGGPSEDQR